MTLSRWATLALLAVRANALSPQDVAAGIRSITDLSSRADGIAKGLSIDNLDQNVPKVTDNLKEMVKMSLKNAEAIPANMSQSGFADSDQSDICKSLSDFSQSYQTYLNTISGKGDILSGNSKAVPLVSVMQVLEGSIDKLESEVIKTVPTCKTQAENNLKELNGNSGDTIDKLSQLIPGGKPAFASGLASVGDDLAQATSTSGSPGGNKRSVPTTAMAAETPGKRGFVHREKSR
ncbi:hypothetical protein C2857_007157 [Epichloe festucae Fl1]|uniref:Cell wall protein n=1 Tax=Epichloe festucae (strain Fl1) TaxID=877507 RepID=A0A7S9KQI6_EPIFF|nr:hypothetical protein C2857_007157 [Epichloe festucae Fl1]